MFLRHHRKPQAERRSRSKGLPIVETDRYAIFFLILTCATLLHHVFLTNARLMFTCYIKVTFLKRKNGLLKKAMELVSNIHSSMFKYQFYDLKRGPFLTFGLASDVFSTKGVLCDCEVAVIIFNLNNGKLFEYCSVEPQTVLQKYATYSGPSERRRKEKVRLFLSTKLIFTKTSILTVNAICI